MTNFEDVNWLKYVQKVFDVFPFHWIIYGSNSYKVLMLLPFVWFLLFFICNYYFLFQSMTHLVYRITQDLVGYI